MVKKTRGWQRVVAVISVITLGTGGCQALKPAPDRAAVGASLKQRFGVAFEAPAGVEMGDGITEDEAMAIALWNNAAFQETLLDFAGI